MDLQTRIMHLSGSLLPADKPMDEISRALVKEFDEFKGDERQRDDITVLGIRL